MCEHTQDAGRRLACLQCSGICRGYISPAQENCKTQLSNRLRTEFAEFSFCLSVSSFFFFNGDVGFIAMECSGSEITDGFNGDCDKSCEKYKCV